MTDESLDDAALQFLNEYTEPHNTTATSGEIHAALFELLKLVRDRTREDAAKVCEERGWYYLNAAVRVSDGMHEECTETERQSVDQHRIICRELERTASEIRGRRR